ncbi:MAG: cytochrome c biogenesis protein CcsA [Anaerolineaceae bacterium]|jgi:heme exporter protein C|nr:cytochrome c biogenesis protein CcsA [Anaerolineaceae bacterium]MDD4042472.1 cytochrome c biogenesis protein CcsA [Anaerolineaceae bacterium]
MLSLNKSFRFFAILAGILVLIAFGLVLFYAPVEQNMGMVQKVFYFHVAAAWLGMLGFLVAALCAVLYLMKGDLKLDAVAASSVEIGLLFTAIANFTGMIWARPVWNTWWTWDPRLTTMTIMAFTYIAYFLLRRGIDDPAKKARFGSIYLIIGFATVPLTFFSARLLRTIHPTIFGNAGTGEMAMTPAMYQTMGFSIFAFSVLFAVLLIARTRLRLSERWLEEQEALEQEEEFGEVSGG